MTQRTDLYFAVHKGLRSAMHATLVRLGQIDPADREDVMGALAQLRELLVWLEDHLEIEERFVHSAIERERAGGRLVAVRHDHEDHARAIALLRSDADALEATLGGGTVDHGAARARVRQLYLAFSRFVGENLVHMTSEETEMNALLWQLFTDEQLLALFGAIIGSESAEQLGRSVRWVIPALDPDERAMAIASARPGMAPVVFDHVLSGIRGGLSARDWAKLASALGVDQAA